MGHLKVVREVLCVQCSRSNGYKAADIPNRNHEIIHTHVKLDDGLAAKVCKTLSVSLPTCVSLSSLASSIGIVR